MKKLVGLWGLLWSACFPAWCQVDTTYIYNTSMPYGTLDIRVAKSPTRYYYLQEDTTFSYRESSPGVKTYTYRDMTSWDSSPYREGNLREKNGNQNLFVMNYRFLMPRNYNPSYDPGYPIIIMFHGLGERANCWNDNCYWSTGGWNPNTNSPPAPTSATHNLLNNDHNLLHGGLKHLTAVNLAGAKLPNDPTLPATAFPGFVLFPQNLNGWAQPARIEDAIRLLRLLIKKYNIDENRVYIHGLSNGGGAVFQAIKRAPWLFAAALPMSAINDGGIIHDGLAQEAGKIPLWIFQGGQDSNPTPSKTFNTVKRLEEAGADVRYYLYPQLGHGTWNTAYNEPDFFSWMLSKAKYQPHVYYGNPVICSTTGTGVRISFSNGFPSYQWERDGEMITDAHQSQYIANTPGTYRGRLSRKSNPSENDWEPWSDQIVVTEVNPAKPAIDVVGTTHLRGPGLTSLPVNNTVILKSQPVAELYTWYKNGNPVDFPITDIDDTLRIATFTGSGSGANGAYTLVTSYSYCPSPPSDPVYLFFNNSAPPNISLNSAQVDFKGVVMSSGVFLTWNDLASNETGYEIWRKKSGTADFKFAGKTAKDAISFFDSPLEPSTTYLYKLRAVSNTGASNYIPSNTVTINYAITTLPDVTLPSPPQQLMMTGNTIGSVTLSWQAAQDNTGIREYQITYGGTTISTNSPSTTFTITDLSQNTVFPVVVKAVDHAGNISPASNQIIASTYVLGLFYKHSTGAWDDLDDSAMVATFKSPEFTGTISNFSLAPRTQEDFFNFEFSGYLDVLTEGNYVFRTTSDDGSRLILDGSAIVDNDGKHGNITVVSDTLHLATGPHSLRVQFFEYTGGQNLTVQYKGPDISKPFAAIPDSLFRSGKFKPSAPPPIPADLTATTAGMERIDLAWQISGNTETELYRSTSASGVFSIIGRSSASAFADSTGLIPGTTYYYKARAVSGTALSAFTAVVSSVTENDIVAPSTPSGLQLSNKTHTRVAFTWNASADNTGVTGYEILVNGSVAGTSEIPGFMVTDLMPGTSYNFTVKAMDAAGNRSAASAALAVTTNPSAIFYSLAAGNLNEVSTWKQNSNGSGNSPASFSEPGQYFVISNRTQTGLGGAWDVTGSASKIIVPAGVTLSADHAFSGKLELEGTAILNLDHVAVPDLQKISATSTIRFNAGSFIPKHKYGHVVLSGAGIKTFEGDTTTIFGNLSVGNGIILKGNSTNASLLELHGNLTVNGFSGMPAADNRIDLKFSENVTHIISAGGDLFFYRITVGSNSTVNVVSTGQPVRVITGSLNGGGLQLENGSALAMGNGNIDVVFAGSINPGNESGRIGIIEGSLKLTSSSGLNSNLYFDTPDNRIDSLFVNLSGSGAVVVRSDVKISTGIKIKNGRLNSDGYITLLDSPSGTASIDEIENGGNISGTMKVQHYLEPAGGSWRDISTPVSGIKISDWQNYFPVTGPFTGSSGGITEPSLFISNGTGMTGYPSSGGTNQAPLEPGKGYWTKLDQAGAVTLEENGNPFQGTVSFILQSGSGGGANAGWNLLGNPYASSVAWSDDQASWTRSGVSSTIAVKENKLINGQPVIQYAYYNPVLGRGAIGAGQGFWVQATNSSPVLTINEKAKVAELSSVYPQTDASASYLIVSLAQGSVADKTYIVYAAEATDDFDNALDGLKRQNEGMFNLSTVAGNINLAFNHLSNSFCSKSTNLNLQQVSPGTYSLAFDGVQSLAGLGSVTLTDHYLGNTISVNGSAYSFSVTSDAASYGAGRFTITVSRYQLNTVAPQVHAEAVCGEDLATVNVEQAQAGVEYVVINSNDEPISETIQAIEPVVSLQIPTTALHEGANHIRIRAGFPGCNAALLNSEADIEFTPSFFISATEDVSVCHGDQAMLQASGVPEGGHYRWVDENNVTIDSVTDGTLLTNPVVVETIVQVGGVLANGCESDLVTIHLYADTLEIPVIILQADTLFVQVEANYQWMKNGTAIEGATKPFYILSGSGAYQVMVSRMGCSKHSAPFDYIVDPGCQLNTTVPVASALDNCGDEVIPLTISNSQSGVVYRAINKNEEIISLPQTGTGGSIILALSSAGLDSGVNNIRVRADLEGCVDRVLASQAVFTYIPPIPKPTITAADGTLITSAMGLYQWKKGGEIIAGATSSSYQPQSSGFYSVVITWGNCHAESDPFDFTVTITTGISSAASEFVLNVYPVPSRGDQLTISIQSPRPEPVFIQLIDITGRNLFHQRYAAGELGTGIPVMPKSGPLTNGIYCVIAIQGQVELRRRVVVKN